MIDETIEAYASAARRAQEGGLDGVEIHYGHSFLVMQFLSPTTNRRTDKYGGSPENRWRFGKEVAAAIRAAVGPDFIIGARLSGREGVPGGLEPEDCKSIALDLEATGLVDLFSISTAGYLDFDRLIGGMHEEHTYELPQSAPASRALTKPSFVVGRILTLAEADAIIASGEADMVSMIRATIADPDIVRKTQAGYVDDVRPCLGCNQGCIGGGTGPLMRFGCVVNVGAGQELRFGEDKITLSDESKRVIIVGGGPAGLEAARVAALRAHRRSRRRARACAARRSGRSAIRSRRSRAAPRPAEPAARRSTARCGAARCSGFPWSTARGPRCLRPAPREAASR